MKIAFQFIFLSALFFSSCKSGGNFSVEAPKDWLVTDTVTKTERRSVKMKPPIYSDTPMFVRNIRISIEHYFNTKIYMKGVLAQVKKDAVLFEEEGDGTIEINNRDVIWEQHIMRLKQNSKDVLQKTYFISDYGTIYMIICSCKPSEVDAFQKEINLVLKSFKIVN